MLMNSVPITRFNFHNIIVHSHHWSAAFFLTVNECVRVCVWVQTHSCWLTILISPLFTNVSSQSNDKTSGSLF